MHSMKLKGAKLYKIEMDTLVRAALAPAAVTLEHRFFAGRLWRLDYASVAELIAIEIEGGVHTLGRHTRGAGYERDLEKYNTAAAHGWCVLRITPEHVRRGDAAMWVRLVRGWRQARLSAGSA